MKMLILNGPPGAGKDTLLEIIRKELDFGAHLKYPFSFKDVLYKRGAVENNLPLPVYKEICSDVNTKRVPQEMLGGQIPTDTLIHVSEVLFKNDGEDPIAVARATFENIERELQHHLDEALLMNADGGFNCEVDHALERFKLKREDIFIVRIDREGHDFSKCSREYLKDPDLHIHNDGTLEDLHKHLPAIQQFITNGGGANHS